MTPLRRTSWAAIASTKSLRLGFGLLAAAVTLGPVATAIRAQAATASGAVTGRVRNATSNQYIKNALVEVVGTGLSTRTDEFGDYVLRGVPAGPVQLRVSYAGLDTRTVPVVVTAGAAANQEITLTRDAVAAGDKTVKLDAYVVSSERETNASAIATNEQRYADNIKTVASTDQFGGVHEGNAAEFLKYLPGVAVDYVGSNANTIILRGFGAAYTGVSVDGARVATAGTGSATRATEFWVLNTNNASRVEITKEPTPDQPADSLGGSINLVTRSAFEYVKPVTLWTLDASVNDQYPNPFHKTAGPYNKSTYKVLPGGSINFIDPINKKFGITVNGIVSNQFNVQRRRYAYWLGSGSTPPGISPSTPYLYLWSIQDSPSDVHRQSYSIKADWKITPNQVLGLTLQTNKYFLQYDNRAFTVTPQSITAFGPTFSDGSLSTRSPASVSDAVRQFYNNSDQAILTYRFQSGDWKVRANASKSLATAEFQDTAKGHFNNANASMIAAGGVKAVVSGVSASVPKTVVFTDANGNAIDFRDMNNYRMATVESDPVLGHADMLDSNADVQRAFDIHRIPFKVMLGGSYRTNTRDNRRQRYLYDFVGADGLPNTVDDSAAPFLDTAYLNQNNAWGWSNLRTVSSYKLYETFKDHPEYFRRRTASDYINNASNSEFLRENVTAYFARFDAGLIHNRLHIVTGVRYELTQDSGLGLLADPAAVYQRNPDGTFVHDTAGNRVRKSDAGAPGSLQEAQLIYHERGYAGASKYHGYYPSINADFNVTDNTLLRFAYAKTFGRPDLSNVVPTATVTTYDDSQAANAGVLGTVTATNVALKPWTAKSYDLSLEHYFNRGGVASIGVFRKDISDFISVLTTPLTAELAAQFGVSPEYIGYQLTTKVNSGAARVDGLELNYQQRFDFTILPVWLRDFGVSSNLTELHMSSASNTADFSTFIKETGNIALTYSAHRWVVMAKLNYRGKQLWTGWRSSVFGPDSRLYYAPRKYIDLNLEYQLTKHVGVYCEVRNLTDVPQKWIIAGPQTPSYATDYWIDTFGRQIVVGLKGSF